MIAEQKKVLLEQMEKRRFLPITEETPRLYDAYNAIIDTHNPDELSCLLFYKAEYFYRIGKFNESLNYLSRTLQAPKHNKFLRFNALSYNIMGRIYSSLNQEYIAINTLMLGKSLCESASLDYELALCCVTLGNVYSQLDDCTTAISYYDLAIEHLRTHESESSDMLLLCEVCRGILFCKTGKPEKALSIHEKIKDSWKQTSSPLYLCPCF